MCLVTKSVSMIVQMFWNCFKKIHKRDSYSCKCVPSKFSRLGIIQINESCDCGLAYIVKSSPVITAVRSVPDLDNVVKLSNSFNSDDEVSNSFVYLFQSLILNWSFEL